MLIDIINCLRCSHSFAPASTRKGTVIFIVRNIFPSPIERCYLMVKCTALIRTLQVELIVALPKIVAEKMIELEQNVIVCFE